MDSIDLEELASAVQLGDRRALARAVSTLEADAPGAAALVASLYGTNSAVRSIGITGPPGVGKSTLTDRLLGLLRAGGQRCAVLAVDPSSPFSGGAILGDRIRMSSHAADDGVYVRSMASRGHLGGLSEAAGRAIVVLSAAPFDRILIESVGVGQSEIEITGNADTTLVVLDPSFGDGVQAEKAGLLEVADVFAVNKADSGRAGEAARLLREMVSRGSPGGWVPPVIEVSALDNEGIDELQQTIERHLAWLDASGGLSQRRSMRALRQFEEAVRERITKSIRDGAVATADIVDAVESLVLDPWLAAESTLSGLMDSRDG